jgi:apolipoprotein N-acyltransferase
MLHGLARRIMTLTGWRRLALAFVSGCMAAAAMPPLLLWPLLFAAFPILVWLLDAGGREQRNRLSSAARAFAVGWAFGFGFFVVSLYWTGAAFLVDAKTYGWMMPFAVAALPAGMALYWAGATALASLAWTEGIARIFLLSALLAIAEWLRGHLFTGFPWNALGYATEAFDGLAQIAAYIGIWGLTLLVILWSALPVIWGDAPRRWARPAASCILLAAVFLAAAGTMRLHGSDQASSGIRLRIVQPNVPQSDKWRSDNALPILEELIALSKGAANVEGANPSPPALIIWPESSVPFLIDEEPRALALIAQALDDSSHLLMGSLRRDVSTDGAYQRVFNSLFAMNGRGNINAVYDKHHLVPYGEYLPMAAWLEPLGLRRLVTVPGSFEPGRGPRTLAISPLPSFSPLICYEVIFPGQVSDRERRPDWLLNITNDGWFGITTGPYQHLSQARFRAIEEGLPLVRSANTGISAVIDAHGRVRQSLRLGRKGVIDGLLPPALAATPYVRFRDLPFWLLTLASLAASLVLQLSPKPSLVRAR